MIALAVLAGFEAVTRLDDWSRYGTPLTASAIALDDLFVRDSLGAHARPNQWFRKFRVDEAGFRLHGRSVPDARASSVVVTAGASETFGLYESAGREWPAQLQDSLGQLCAAPPRVRNAAFAGMSLPTVEQDIRLRLAALRPAVIVYYPTPMQYLEDALPRATAVERTASPPPSPWRSRALPRVRDAVKNAVPNAMLNVLRRWSAERRRAGRPAGWLLTSIPPDRLRAYEHGLESIIQSTREIGAEPVLVVHANRFGRERTDADRGWLASWERFYPRATGALLIAFDSAAAEVTHAVGRRRGVPVVDARPALGVNAGALFADFSHFTDAGAGIVAGQVARVLAPMACRGESR